uniref:Interferon lambda-3 n=1 Tax=Geotrypetes seraphini TaxID=260995 RepID=A0A6P8S5E0_GEOSA|nr:interferon lambda-3 [Geotrypetes seraphini]XP_033813264.1 interferon lambda-3 [Geotrypetes seraphini]
MDSLLGKVLIATILLTADGAPATKCFIAKYRDLPPSEIKAIRHLKDAYESYIQTMPAKEQNCSEELLLQKPTVRDFTEKLIVLKHKVDLAVEVLMNMTNSTLSKNVIKPLEDLQIIGHDLRICVSKHRTQHSHHLKHWLRNFNKIKKAETPDCLQKAVIPRIFQLRQEVVCIAHDKKCEEKRSRLASPAMN